MKTSMESNGAQPAERWYTQFWPWFLILLPATVVIASFTTLYIAIQSPDKVVRGEYEKLGPVITESGLKQ